MVLHLGRVARRAWGVLVVVGAAIGAGAALAQPVGPTDGELWQVNGTRMFYTGGAVGVGTNSPGIRALFEAVNPGNAVIGESTSPSLSRTGVLGITRSTIGQGVFGQATATTGINAGLLGITFSDAGRGVAGVANSPAGLTYGGRFESASSEGRGVFGRATHSSGETYGVFGTVVSNLGVGVIGVHSAVTGDAPGVLGRTNSMTAEAVGVRGEVISPGPRSVGVMGIGGSHETGFEYFGVLGTGQTGVKGATTTPSGRGVVGEALAATGSSVGVRGHSNSSSGIGVSGSSQNLGVSGRAFSAGGTGVKGEATPSSGATMGVYGVSNSTSGRGVLGEALASNGTVYGVRGIEVSSDPNAFAVFAVGNVGATGTKPFRIDHPFDPANKYLYHYAAEGPEPQNIYNGVVTLDGGGTAWVQLPDYFGEINRDFRYQLTCLGGFAPVYVADKIKDNRFRIAGGTPGLEVSWEVKGVRNDLYVRVNGAPVETEKTGLERGKYQHPEFYGLPREMGMDPLPEAEREPSLAPAAAESR